MMNRVGQYWKTRGIVSKITLSFSVIMILIVAINIIGVYLLFSFQTSTELHITRSEQTKILILELSLKLEKTRQLEKDFFLRYPNMGYDNAYQTYIIAAKDNLSEINLLTEKLSQNVMSSDVREETQVNLKLLSMSQTRHSQTIDDASQLVRELEDPSNGLLKLWRENLSELFNTFNDLDTPGVWSLLNEVDFMAKQYLVRQKRPDIQRSFNATLLLKDKIAMTKSIPPAESAQLIRLLDDHITLGEKISDCYTRVNGKLREFDLQTDTVRTVTENMILSANQEITASRKRNHRFFGLIVFSIIGSVVVLIVVVWLIGKIMGRSVARKIVDLSVVMKSFESGEYSARMPSTSEDEISFLARGFNQLADRLRDLINNLESQVVSRTKELNDSNERLKEEIREHVQLREELKRQRELLESIVYNIPVLLTIYDPQLRSLKVNKHFEEIIGWTNEDLKSIDLMAECYPDPDYRKKASEYMEQAVSEWKEFIVRTKSGQELSSIWSNIKLYDNTQIGIGIDITEQNRHEKQIEDSLREKEVLLQEIHHRVKNNMQVISSLLTLQMGSMSDTRDIEAFKETKDRIFTMSAVHEALYSSTNLSVVDLREYLSSILNSLSQSYSINSSKIQVSVNIEKIQLGISQSTVVGLVVNELVSNSFKYAFPDGRDGTVKIEGQIVNQAEVELSVEDDGVGVPETFDWKTTKTLGTRLIRTLVKSQLEGTIEVEQQKGLKYIIRIPLKY